MVALSDIVSRSIDRARDSTERRYEEHVILSGRLQQTVVVLLEGTTLPPHHSEVTASFYVLHGALKVVAEEPFVLQSGVLHEMPPQRREVIALQDTVLLLTAVPEGAEEREALYVPPIA